MIHHYSKGSLEGVRVIDVTHAMAGILAAMHLADMGAEVIKIERKAGAGGGGVGARIQTAYSVDGYDMRFVELNRNKKSMTLDLKAAGAKEVFYDLAKKSDVVMDNFRPAVMERLGIHYEALRKVNPRIICASISGFGTTGPYRDRPAIDSVAQALGGLTRMIGEPGRPPLQPHPIADMGSAAFTAMGIVAALYYRARTGLGQKVDVSLLDTCLRCLTYFGAHYLNSGILPQPMGRMLGMLALIGNYKTKDDYIALGAPTEENWPALCRVLGHEELLKDPRFDTREKRWVFNKEALNATVEELLQTKTTAEWVELMAREEIAAAPVNTLDKVFADPQVVQGGMVVNTEYDGRRFKVLGNPIKMSAQKQEYNSPPKQGEHNHEILGQLLGYSAGKINELEKQRII